MPVTISIPTALRQYAGGSSEIKVEATTAGEALERLTQTHAELRKHLYSDRNTLRNFVNVYVNDEDIRHADGAQTPVKDGDTIMIVPSIAGGATAEQEVAKDLPALSNQEIARYSRH
nr:MoaD/ThiS family protein [Acidobacteriota bacterium]